MWNWFEVHFEDALVFSRPVYFMGIVVSAGQREPSHPMGPGSQSCFMNGLEQVAASSWDRPLLGSHSPRILAHSEIQEGLSIQWELDPKVTSSMRMGYTHWECCPRELVGPLAH